MLWNQYHLFSFSRSKYFTTSGINILYRFLSWPTVPNSNQYRFHQNRIFSFLHTYGLIRWWLSKGSRHEIPFSELHWWRFVSLCPHPWFQLPLKRSFEKVAMLKEEERDEQWRDKQRHDDIYGGLGEEGGCNDGNDNFVVNNANVHAYLGALVPSEAVKAATDCIIAANILDGAKAMWWSPRMVMNTIGWKGEGYLTSVNWEGGSGSDHSITNELILWVFH